MAETSQIILDSYKGYDVHFIEGLIKSTKVMQNLVPVQLVTCTQFQEDETVICTWTFKLITATKAQPRVLNLISDQIIKFFNLVTDNDASIANVNSYSVNDIQYMSVTYYIS